MFNWDRNTFQIIKHKFEAWKLQLGSLTCFLWSASAKWDFQRANLLNFIWNRKKSRFSSQNFIFMAWTILDSSLKKKMFFKITPCESRKWSSTLENVANVDFVITLNGLFSGEQLCWGTCQYKHAKVRLSKSLIHIG